MQDPMHTNSKASLLYKVIARLFPQCLSFSRSNTKYGCFGLFNNQYIFMNMIIKVHEFNGVKI